MTRRTQILASAVVGAGAGAGAVVDQVQKRQIKSDVEQVLPPGSSGIITLLEERWVTDVEKALIQAERSERHHVHSSSETGA